MLPLKELSAKTSLTGSQNTCVLTASLQGEHRTEAAKTGLRRQVSCATLKCLSKGNEKGRKEAWAVFCFHKHTDQEVEQ